MRALFRLVVGMYPSPVQRPLEKMGSCLFALRALRVAALRGRLVAGLVAAVGRLVARVLILLIHAVSPPSG